MDSDIEEDDSVTEDIKAYKNSIMNFVTITLEEMEHTFKNKAIQLKQMKDRVKGMKNKFKEYTCRERNKLQQERHRLNQEKKEWKLE